MPKTPRIPWPPATGADAKHQKCRTCDRCRTGAGREADELASDCWVDYLDVVTQPTRRSA
ncbi:hypothetical protein [Kitasatospora cineracea]|uniref:Uncharacterized protein n=1 Tax=Kitasatospora cineracea TaxID=88074 RepID=A0A3N4RFM4_9ACTN|nr:hypothetical protein [Kitasatospora cineracea]RPE32228.1 hypothetical protein EDD38_0475 [Kitasatospora cineracea]